MTSGKMDEAAAARIRKAKGDKDSFSRRAAMAARRNRDAGKGGKESQDKGGGSEDVKEGVRGQ